MLTIGQLEQSLLKLFPSEKAEAWDKTGLLVGDPSQELHGIVCALDVTMDALAYCEAQGANVLLTHHPAFIKAPSSFKPATSPAVEEGALVYAALRKGIALMNFHTALDFSVAAACFVAELLNVEFKGFLTHKTNAGLCLNAALLNGEDSVFADVTSFGVEQNALQSSSAVILKQESVFGYGSIYQLPQTASVNDLALHCQKSLGGFPRIWGNSHNQVNLCCYASGSGSDMAQYCMQVGISCLVVGEIKYHEALNYLSAGLSIIELGHDVSEFPFAKLLQQKVFDIAAGETDVKVALMPEKPYASLPQS